MPAITKNHIRLISVQSADQNDGLVVSRDHVYRLHSSTGPNIAANSSTTTPVVTCPDFNENSGSQAELAPPYIALSYTWGTDFTSIRCNGESDAHLISVSSNLILALHRLHRFFPGRLLWTDSLSINQADLEEKSQQVGVMGRIYSRAETVAVWLGEAADRLYEELCKLSDVQNKNDVKGNDQESASEARVNLLQALSQIPWFYRVWTFQEIRLASNAVVLFEKEAMPWDQFIGKIQAVRSMEPQMSSVTIRSQTRSHSPFSYVPQDRFFAILNELNTGTTARDLAGLLFVTWYREASERRDKVYSLLSSELLKDFEHRISIDYEIEWSELCIKAARAAISMSGNLKMLKIAGMNLRSRSPVTNRWDTHELQRLLSHPSWVPDWWHPPQQTRSHTSLNFDQRGIFEGFDFCCPLQSPSQDVNDTSPFLKLRGVFLGLINVGDSPTYRGGPIHVHSIPDCARHARDTIEDPSGSGRMVAKVSMSSFVVDVDNHLHGNCTCVPFHQRRGFGRPSFGLPSSSPGGQPTPLRFNNQSFALSYQSLPPEKPESQRPAQVLAQMVECGDWLVLLEGGGLPFVIRPVKDTSGRIPRLQEFQGLGHGEILPYDAGLFVLVGEASLCWDKLWPRWDSIHCRVGTFVLV